MSGAARRMGGVLWAGLAAAVFSVLPAWAQEKEVDLFFTGQAYAALYPCLCPHEPDGGVARRATALAQARAAHPGVLAVEAGATFASGAEDQNAQNLELDNARTDIYLDALRAMGYDALLLSSQEFVFGTGFLKDRQAFPFVSSNTQGYGRPYIVKDVDGIKVGIVGATDAAAVAKGAQTWSAAAPALAREVRAARKEGAGVIVLLSALKPEEDAALLAAVPGIDVAINGVASYGSVKESEVGGALYVSTWWQARKAGLLRLGVSDGKVRFLGLETIDLDASVADDARVAAALPQCLKDSDCAFHAGFVAGCDTQKGPRSGRCTYAEPAPLDVTIIVPKDRLSCRSLPFLTSLQQTFVKVRPRTLDPAEPEARRLLGVVGATTVPVYIFGEDIEQYPLFAQLSQTVEKKGSYYVVHPMFAGACAFLDRPYVSGRLDVFFDLTYPRLAELARRLKELRERDRDIDVRLHFLAAVEPAGGFVARGGDETVEEFRRLACIDASDPQKVFDYLACRTDAAAPGEAQACARAAGLDVDRLSRCATGREGEDALRANIALTDELNIGFGPTLVVGNRDVYAVAEVPSLEELEAIVKAAEKKE